MRDESEKTLLPTDTSSVLGRTMQSLLEAITGVASADRQRWALSLGRILQAVRGGKCVDIMKREWESYREQGRIPSDYESTEQHKECLQELLDFLDDPSPDEVRFQALKKIWLLAATESKSNRDDLLPQQYMHLIRSLTAGETIVLFTTFHSALSTGSVQEWLQEITRRSGLRHPELVELHEDGLIKKRLIVPRAYPDRSGIKWSGFGRLTSLGQNICEFIRSAEELDA